MNWGNEFPSGNISDSCIYIGTDGSTDPVVNKNDITFTSPASIEKNPSSNFTKFHNLGSFNFENYMKNLTFDMSDVDYYLDGGLFNVQKGKIILNGRDFYSQGKFIVKDELNLNFRDFINVNNTKITNNMWGGDMTINLTGKFSNNSTLNIKGEMGIVSVTINGGDFYNGIDHRSGQESFSGSIVLNDNVKVTIEKNLISEGVDRDNHSKIMLGNYWAVLSVGEDFDNRHYSDIYIANLMIAKNIDNQSGGEIHLTGKISASENFISKEGSKLYFSGIDDWHYGKIEAQNVDIRGASLYFSKGETTTNTSYEFLIATRILSYDSSLLGVQDVISDDGSVNDFYEAVVETGVDKDLQKVLKVTFKSKEEVSISSNNNTDTATSATTVNNADSATNDPEEEVNISDNNSTNTGNADSTISAGTIQAIYWGNEFPESLTSENFGEYILLGEDDSASPVYNKSDLSDSLPDSHITISKNPKSNFTEFHNQGGFSTAPYSFTFDMSDVDFYLDGGLFDNQAGYLTLNGRDFYSQGDFIVNGISTLNFRDFINVSGTKISGSFGNMTINLTGKFSNNSKLSVMGSDGYDNRIRVTIGGGDFHNGIDYASGQENFSGSIELKKGLLTIEKNLISEGSSENHSKIILSNNSKLSVGEGYSERDFINGHYSNISINPTHNNYDNSKIYVSGNMINQGEIHVNADESKGGGIYVRGDFTSKEGSKLYFDYTSNGKNEVYNGKIVANNIYVKGASVYFSKGETTTNTSYEFLIATRILSYDSSLLGVQDVISDDGSVNDFYEAVVETGTDEYRRKVLKVTFEPKKEVNTSDNTTTSTTSTTSTGSTKPPKEEVSISSNNNTETATSTTTTSNTDSTTNNPKEEVSISNNSNTDTTTITTNASNADNTTSAETTKPPKEEVNILDNSEKTTIAKIPGIADKYTSDEIALIDTFSKENPIPGFDIKNLGTNQIKTISKNISDGLQSYTHSKDAALSTGFEAIKTNLFARMIGGGNSPSVSHRSAILPYSSSVHYAANTAKSNYPATKASDYTQSDVIAYAPNTNSKDNNLYVNLLGALQTSPGGYGYNYGLSVGYDRNFDDKLFVGVYLAYIGGSLSFDTLSTQTQGFEAGVYARFKTSIFETDMILNQGYAYNKTHKNITILSDTYSTYSHYGTQSYDLLLQSGPRFDFGKNTIKPFIGLNINLNTGGDIDEDAQALASSYHFKDNLYLSESIGIEYKRLFKQGYFFIRPSYEANIWSNASETQVLFLNNTISIAIPPKEMFGSVLLGGEVAINNSLLLNLNASAKASNQKTFIATGMASLKYVF